MARSFSNALMSAAVGVAAVAAMVPTATPALSAPGPATAPAAELLLAAKTPVAHAVAVATYLGGRNDEPLGVATDSAGNIYVVGIARSADFPGTGTTRPAAVGKEDAFVLKLDPTATRVLAVARVGGKDATTTATRVRVGKNRVYVLGTTTGADFPGRTQFPPDVEPGPGDLYVAEFDTDLKLKSAVRLVAEQACYASALAIDAAGNVHIAATVNGRVFPTTPNAADRNLSGRSTGAYVVFNPALTQMRYSTTLNSTSGWAPDVFVAGMTVTPTGVATLVGSGMPPMASTPNAPFKGRDRTASFIARINPSLNAAASMPLLTFADLPRAKFQSVALDARGNVLIAGEFWPPNRDDFKPVNPFQNDWSTRTNGLVARLDPSGIRVDLLSALGGGTHDQPTTILPIIPTGNANAGGGFYVVGWTMSASFPTVVPVQDVFGGTTPHRLGTVGGDLFAVRIGPDGKAEFATTFGGPAPERAADATITPAGDLIIVGSAYGPDFPVTANALVGKFPGGDFAGLLVRMPTTRPAK